MTRAVSERFFRRALVWIALAGLLLGLTAWILGRSDLANWRVMKTIAFVSWQIVDDDDISAPQRWRQR